eukprot:CAMPEP_0185584370 /NCGR_PEP_ID=MMETSP0434-20130131/31842_1 /TAXON_ID=626734 ORGANISM="Favella taraikaensis, Strain Fe Narragansett Bay" /NCGR_SAMPLE_ID=MMETSP0434 /ASSEMBLY_ACC=CAM_ASM_000379 /LENGTH=113 /DNA_ID=CAMNT_0028204071 /DNA_START=577 /DNA_END=918 /DNA_ORIENTATION=-
MIAQFAQIVDAAPEVKTGHMGAVIETFSTLDSLVRFKVPHHRIVLIDYRDLPLRAQAILRFLKAFVSFERERHFRLLKHVIEVSFSVHPTSPIKRALLPKTELLTLLQAQNLA